jgi:hypothetical protein
LGKIFPKVPHAKSLAGGRWGLAGLAPPPQLEDVPKPILTGWPEGLNRPEIEPWMRYMSAPQRKKARRLERGLCIQCNAPHSPGRRYCQRCAQSTAAAERGRRQRRDAEHRAKYGMSEYRLRAMACWHPVRLARAVIG